MVILLLWAFGLIFSYRLTINIVDYIRAIRYRNAYIQWVSSSTTTDRLLTHKRAVCNLLKKAKVKNISVPTSQLINYGKAVAFEADVFTNFPSASEEMFNPTVRLLDEAIGVFRGNALSCFNPLFWIESILFLPRNTLQYIGFTESQVSFRVLNLLLTTIWWLVGAIFVIYKGDIYTLISQFLR